MGLALAALALLSQSLALAAPMGASTTSGARAAQIRLAALFGPAVIVCTQSDAPDAPPVPDCHGVCPLCRLAADVSTLQPPAPPDLAVPIFAFTAELAAKVPPRVDPAPPMRRPWPRGPPSKT